MANTIKLKRSSTASSVPAAGDLAVGELAVNTADKKLYTKHGSSIVELNGSNTWRSISNSTSTTSSTVSASQTAVKSAYDKGNHSHPYAASSHTHSYLPTGGGTMTGVLTLNASGSHIVLDTLAAGQNNWVTWKDNGTNKWEINKSTTHDFNIYSYTLGSNVITFKETGNVGIGRDAPASLFEVHLDTNKNIGFSGAQGEVGNVPALVAYQDAGSLASMGFRGVDLRFATGSSERLRIDSSGNVDIKTSGANLKLAYNTTDSYSANLGWRHLQLGNNGGNYIIGGNTNTGGKLMFVVNNTTDLSSNNGSSHNGTLAMTIESSGNVGIAGGAAVNLHINKGSSTYQPAAGVIKNYVAINTDYTSSGGQGIYFAHLDGNWLDGTSGGDTQFGMLFGWENQTRGGLIYDHRSSEMMSLWSSYGPLRFMTPDSADGDGVPTDSNINARLTIAVGGAATFSSTVAWSGGGSANANTAYGWGNHASAGYTTNTGDITGVTAGTGMSGGGTSGTVTLTNSSPNIVQTTISGNAFSASSLQQHQNNANPNNLNTLPWGKTSNYASTGYWSNGPSGMSYGSVYNFGGYSGTSSLALQLAADVTHNSSSSTKDLWFRTGNNLGFQADWRKVWNSGNDGSGSGLDADLLDGQQGSYYSPTTHTHNYFNSTVGSGSFSASAHAIYRNGTAPVPSSYDTFVIAQSDVPCLSIIESVDGTQANEQQLKIAVGDGDAVISTANVSGGLHLRVNRATNQPGYHEGYGTAGIHISNAGNTTIGGTLTGVGSISSTPQGTLWGATNDGSGSGLDADTLDGQQGSYYSPTTHTHSYGDITNVAVTSPITGGGTSGSVTISHSTAAGNKHIPTGGNANQYLKYSSSGTATWSTITGSDASILLEDITEVSMVSQNVLVGSYPAFPDRTTGDYNTGLGQFIFEELTTGSGNIAIGASSCEDITTGSDNIAIGVNAGTANQTGIGNVYLGLSAGYSQGTNSDGSHNVAIGVSAQYTNGCNNAISIGYQSNYTGLSDYGVAVGYQSAKYSKGSNNINIGYHAGYGNTSYSPYSNVNIGTYAGGYVRGNYNVAVGYYAQRYAYWSDYSTAVGSYAMRNGSADNNTAIGYKAGYSTTGIANTFLGRDAGYSTITTTSGTYNTLLGAYAGGSSSTASNEFTLGNNAVSNLRCNDTSISSLSDQRDKAEILDLPDEAGLDLINSLRPVTFYWDRREWYDSGVTPDGSKIKRDYRSWKSNSGQRQGFIAQEVEVAISGHKSLEDSQVVNGTADKKEFAPQHLLTNAIKAIQQLSAENTALIARIEALENN